MSARIEKDGKFYRMRRGVLVEIPAEWVGQTTHPQTIRKRPSKQTRKVRNDNVPRHPGPTGEYVWKQPRREEQEQTSEIEEATLIRSTSTKENE